VVLHSASTLANGTVVSNLFEYSAGGVVGQIGAVLVADDTLAPDTPTPTSTPTSTATPTVTPTPTVTRTPTEAGRLWLPLVMR